jgi:hypothetical protein
VVLQIAGVRESEIVMMLVIEVVSLMMRFLAFDCEKQNKQARRRSRSKCALHQVMQKPTQSFSEPHRSRIPNFAFHPLLNHNDSKAESKRPSRALIIQYSLHPPSS